MSESKLTTAVVRSLHLFAMHSVVRAAASRAGSLFRPLPRAAEIDVVSVSRVNGAVCFQPAGPVQRALARQCVSSKSKVRRGMSQIVVAIGISMVVLGLIIEFAAFAAMGFYPVRRILPMKSPIQLQSTGCAVFFLGVVLVLLARLF